VCIAYALEIVTSGEGGIRTHEDLSALLPFQGSRFNHSRTSPLVPAHLWAAKRIKTKNPPSSAGF
jgi:hypothetical protein